MSQENVEIVREAYERFVVPGEFADLGTDDFAWDMSNFHGWPGQQVYEGVDGARAFLSEWIDAWEDWELELEALYDAGDRVVALVYQRGRSKEGGMAVEMSFAQVWTLRDAKQARTEMYSERATPSKPPGCRSRRGRRTSKSDAGERRLVVAIPAQPDRVPDPVVHRVALTWWTSNDTSVRPQSAQRCP